MGAAKSDIEYVFKVNLKAARRIFRTLALRGDQTLDDLHNAIFEAFDRFDPHLYSFYFPKAPGRRRTAGPRPTEYTSAQMFDDPSRFDAAATRLDKLRLKPGKKFDYLFDFGDEWWHEGTVVAVNRADPQGKYWEIRQSQGESPPQYEEEYDDE